MQSGRLAPDLPQRKQPLMQFSQDKAGFSSLTILLQVYLPSVPWLCPTDREQRKALNFKTALFSCLDATRLINNPSLSSAGTVCSFTAEMHRSRHYVDSGLWTAPLH